MHRTDIKCIQDLNVAKQLKSKTSKVNTINFDISVEKCVIKVDRRRPTAYANTSKLNFFNNFEGVNNKISPMMGWKKQWSLIDVVCEANNEKLI